MSRVTIALLIIGLGILSVAASSQSPSSTYMSDNALIIRHNELINSISNVLPSEATLREIASIHAQLNGLTSITASHSRVLSLGTWLGQLSVSETYHDINRQVYVISFRGDGIWSGFGGLGTEVEQISGMTIALDTLTGEIITVTGAAMNLEEVTKPDSEQIYPVSGSSSLED